MKIEIPLSEIIRSEIAPVQQSIKDLKASISLQSFEPRYYRNKDLKRLFGFSDNTIIAYRDNNIIPYTKLGEIYFYPVGEINKLLEVNSNYVMVKI